MKHVLVGILTMMFLCAPSGQAQQNTAMNAGGAVPTLVKFSGRLTDANGKPRTGVVGVTFLLYKEEQGGAPLWMETQGVAPDKNGQYSVMLGSTRSTGLPTDLFASSEARWLAVQPEGQAEQARVLLLSVPYALKAGDAATLGGLPPSAFVLAAPAGANSAAANSSAGTTPATVAPPTTLNVTTTGGTANTFAMFTTGTNIQNSIVTQTGTTAVNVAGKLILPSTGTATSTAGKNSQPEAFVASSYNSGTAAAVNQKFQWQAEPTGNNTTTPAGTMNLLYGSGTSAPAETGFKINSKGLVTFASGQTYPGAGTVQTVALAAPASDFTVSGSPITVHGTLNLGWKVAPTSANTANAIVKRDASGNFSGNTISSNAMYSGSLTLSNYLSLVGTEYAYFTGNAPAVWGVAAASTGTVYGVEGETYSDGGYGVYGLADAFTGNANGVYGKSNAGGSGVVGVNTSYGAGITGISTGGGPAGSFQGNVQLSGRVTTYNGAATYGNGVSSIVSEYTDYSYGAGSSGYFTIYTPPNDGVFRLMLFQECTTTSGGGTIFAPGFIWTLPTGGQGAYGGIGGPDCSSLNNFTETFILHVKGGTAIQFEYPGMNAQFQNLVLIEQLM